MGELATYSKTSYPLINLPDAMVDQAIAVQNHIIMTPCDTAGEWDESRFDDQPNKPDKSGYLHLKVDIDGQDVCMHIHATQLVRSHEPGPKQGLSPIDVRTFPQPEINAFISQHQKVLSIEPPKRQGIAHGDAVGT